MSQAAKQQTSRSLMLIRHGQGHHNQRHNYDLHDPRLTEIGRQQAAALQDFMNEKIVACSGASDNTLFVVSPLKRAIETLALACPFLLQRHHPVHPDHGTAGNGGSGGATAGSNFTVVISPLITERHVGNRCDEGTSPAQLADEFPFIRHWKGFDELSERWWPTEAEDAEWERVRVPAFKSWLEQQQHDQIVAVGHGCFFSQLVGGRIMHNCEVLNLRL